MDLHFTQYFDDAYLALSSADVGAVDAMLDRLEQEHAHGHMRNVISIGTAKLFATPRFEAPSGTYRITWQYDDAGNPSAISCVTVAKTDVRFPL